MSDSPQPETQCKAPSQQCPEPHWCEAEGECLYLKWHPSTAKTMTDSPELAAIRARDACITWPMKDSSQAQRDVRTLLRMLDEAHKRLKLLEEMGAECVNDWQKIEKLVKERDEARADAERERMRLAACGVAALGYFNGCADEYRSASLEDVLKLHAENERLREAMERGSDG